jgi:hypothetical protein
MIHGYLRETLPDGKTPEPRKSLFSQHYDGGKKAGFNTVCRCKMMFAVAA